MHRANSFGLRLALVLFWSNLLAAVPVAFSAERILSIPGDTYSITGTLTLPEEAQAPVPGLLMLHGTASQKNEVGDLYGRLARRLATLGIASLRIDFAGSGDSPVSHRLFTLSSATRDAQIARRFLAAQPGVQAQSIAVLGFSQGGLIAQRLVLADGRVKALLTWSTAAMDGAGSFDRFFDRYYDEAQTQGYARISFPWLDAPLDFDHQWFEEISAQRTLSAMSAFTGPILAIAGTADTTVPYTQSVELVSRSSNSASRSVILAGADHIFNVLAAANDSAVEPRSDALLLDISSRWLLEVLGD